MWPMQALQGKLKVATHFFYKLGNRRPSDDQFIASMAAHRTRTVAADGDLLRNIMGAGMRFILRKVGDAALGCTTAAIRGVCGGVNCGLVAGRWRGCRLEPRLFNS
mmetsp:Transcript_10583/g.24089  ORF Transcript_10583/g.24089 Transcript_10583/m.24089 type:complete len:106 (-) Transcript_10583:757-1074(-)